MMDYGPKEPIRLFESASMMLYLADKFDAFLSKDVAKRAETMNWLFWQMGSAPFVGGGFGHFYAYAPEKLEYPINRYAMETKRQLDVLDRQLAEHEFVSGSDYTIADMAIFPWHGGLVLGRAYNAAEFLDVGTYKNVIRWAKQVDAREPVKRGRCVNAAGGPEDEQLHALVPTRLPAPASHSGRHQLSLSRYHCTVRRSPSSTETDGSQPSSSRMRVASMA